MKRIVYGLLLVLLGAGITYVLIRGLGPAPAEESRAEAVAKVTRRDISSSVLATGIVKPMVGAEVRVGSRISGVVRHLHTNIGDTVELGQILAELETTELQARLDQADASLRRARAELEFASLDLKRKKDLWEQEMTAQVELEDAEKAHQLALIQVEDAEANREYAAIQLNYARISAPISGVVASVSTQEGETVTAGFSTPTFVTIIDLDRLELWAYVDETDIGRVKEGQAAVFTVDTYPDTEFEGRVVSIHPDAVIQNTVVNYITIVSIENRKGKTLRPEMTTNVTIFLETRDDVLSVPRQAVQREGGRYVVRVVTDGGIEERQVRVGWRDDVYTEITEGLSEGETVLLGEP